MKDGKYVKCAKYLTCLLMAALLLCAMGTTSSAHEVPDRDRAGSISLTMEDQGKAVPGGRVTAYRVGEIAEDNGNYSFALSLEFAASGADLEDVGSAELAEKLADYAKEQKLTGTSVDIGNDGTAKFAGLTPGLFLIVQSRAADGYEAVSPFLVSVPVYENETYVYDVDATPKMETLSREEEPEDPVQPATPVEKKLPQTGQLNWPVPVLAVLGLVLFLSGWALRYGEDRECAKRHET